VSVIKFVIVSVIALIAAAWVSVQFPGYARSLARRVGGDWYEPTGEEATERIVLRKPDVIVTQLDMDLKMAQDILEELRRVSSDSRILVLTVFDSLHFLKALCRMAIDAYVHKSSFPQELVETIDDLSRQAGGDNAVIAMPRGMLERLDGEAVGAHRRGRRRFWC